MISLLAAAAALSLKLVSLHDFALGCRCRLVSQACLPSQLRSWLPLPPGLPSLSPFMISLLAAAAAVVPKLVSVPDFALGCRCRFVIFLPAFDADAVIRLFRFLFTFSILFPALSGMSPKLVSRSCHAIQLFLKCYLGSMPV